MNKICVSHIASNRDIDPKGLKLILEALLKEKQDEEVERNKKGGGWKISGFSILVILKKNTHSNLKSFRYPPSQARYNHGKILEGDPWHHWPPPFPDSLHLLWSQEDLLDL